MADAINPHIAAPSPLIDLASRAIRQYGDMAIETVDGDLLLMFLDFANRIVEDLNAHPYRDNEDGIEYFVHQSDVRPIPDMILIAGLKAYYAEQQLSQKATLYMPQYHKVMNQLLYQRRFGNKRKNLTPIESSQCDPYTIVDRE